MKLALDLMQQHPLRSRLAAAFLLCLFLLAAGFFSEWLEWRKGRRREPLQGFFGLLLVWFLVLTPPAVTVSLVLYIFVWTPLQVKPG